MNKAYILVIIIMQASSLQSFSYGNYGSKDTGADKKKAMAMARAQEHQRQQRLQNEKKREQQKIEERKRRESLNK